ncbi:MAG TPA: hypothetical protein VHB98_16095 [Chloroflexota bacterium]|nr:hypothetical protein [Chloroflexota bacterium]
MVKRLGIGILVIAVAALGAGMLASSRNPATASGATRQHTTATLVSHMVLHASLSRTTSPSSRIIAAARAAPQVRATPSNPTTAAHGVRASASSAVTPATQRTIPSITATASISSTATAPVTATVQVVDPAAVQLPQAGPLLLLNPNTAALGGTINVIGSGFDGSKLITLTLTLPAGQAPIVLDTAQASRGGDFSKNVTLPSALPSNSFKIVAQERKGYAHASAPGTIAIGSPRATLSTEVGKPGDTVYGTASGFNANEKVDVFLNNLGTTPVTTLQAGADGKLSLAPIPVPYGSAGPTSLLLLGRQSRGLAAIPFELLSLYPNAAVSSYSAVADTVLRFSASGFGPNEYVDVHINMADSVIVGRLQADSAGSIRNGGSFRIPFSLKPHNIFVLTGEQSHTSATIAFTVQPYTPLAVPSTYDGSPGTAFTFYGSGFARNETVRVSLDGRQVATMTTDNLGNLIARPGLYLIGPTTQPGKLHFMLAGAESVTAVPVTVNVAPAAGPVQLGVTTTSGGQ